MTYNQLRREISARFRRCELESPDLEARLLVLHVSGLSHSDLILRGGEPVPAKIAAHVKTLAARREGGEPLDHIFGYREFYGRRFDINAHVLSPRQDTEGVVTRALKAIEPVPAPHILDLGTGSGAIIISCLAERPQAKGTGIDISDAALATTRANAERHGVTSRLDLFPGHWFNPLGDTVSASFDLIVSNPPYITEGAMAELPGEVSGFDPDIALAGGPDGLRAYREIIDRAPAFLKPGGWLVFEIGCDQGAAVQGLMTNSGFENIELIQDLSGLDRVVCGQKPA